MELKDIKDYEFSELKKLHEEMVDANGYNWKIDDTIHCMRRCECCGELFIPEDDTDLPVVRNWDGRLLHCCEECYNELKEDEYRENNCEPDEYDKWHDKMLCEGLI